MATYNHAYALAFEVKSNRADASDVSALMLTAAILRRIAELQTQPAHDNMSAACEAPFDTYKESDE